MHRHVFMALLYFVRELLIKRVFNILHTGFSLKIVFFPQNTATHPLHVEEQHRKRSECTVTLIG